MDQEAVNPAITILKWMEINKTISNYSGVDYCEHIPFFHTLVGSNQTFHQIGQEN
jgi:hypothetical protein